jgi:hypothetical protein
LIQIKCRGALLCNPRFIDWVQEVAMKLLRSTGSALAILVAVWAPFNAASPALAQTQPSEAEQDAAAAEDEGPDPLVIDALLQMGATLIDLQEFSVTLESTVEQVMDSGQKLEFGGTVLYRVRRPDRMRVDILTDTGAGNFFYDGQSLTLWTPHKGFYGSAAAKPTIRETIEWAEDEYGIEVPLADLFDWGSERAPIDEIEVAFLVGSARINGVNCAHFAFRTAEVDWEVWVETGTRPLPRKFTITDRTQEDLPRFEATLTWSTLEDFEDVIFMFDPPASAARIPLATLSEMAALPRQE